MLRGGTGLSALTGGFVMLPQGKRVLVREKFSTCLLLMHVLCGFAPFYHDFTQQEDPYFVRPHDWISLSLYPEGGGISFLYQLPRVRYCVTVGKTDRGRHCKY